MKCATIGLALLAAALGWWVNALRAEVATLEADAAKGLAAQQQAARVHEEKIAEREREHAAGQQRKEDEYAKEKELLARQRDSERAAAVRLRDQLAAATARRSPGGGADTAASERDADRLAELGRLAGEGVELVSEARSLLRERDGQVARLLDQITLDRQACEPGGH